MGKYLKFLLFVVAIAGFVYAADEGGTTSAQPKAVQTSDSSAQDRQKSVAKTKIIKPVSKTNWSKIKDLFM